jgi:hypothetical protein
MPSAREQHAEHADDQRDAKAEQDRRQHVAALLIGAEQERALPVRGPQRRDARIDQLQLRRVERVLDGENGREDRKQEEQHGDGARDHCHARAAEGIEQVASGRAPNPTLG